MHYSAQTRYAFLASRLIAVTVFYIIVAFTLGVDSASAQISAGGSCTINGQTCDEYFADNPSGRSSTTPRETSSSSGSSSSGSSNSSSSTSSDSSGITGDGVLAVVVGVVVVGYIAGRILNRVRSNQKTEDASLPESEVPATNIICATGNPAFSAKSQSWTCLN